MRPPTNQVIHGDAVEIMRTIPSGAFDTIITDPPYFKVIKATWDNAHTTKSDYFTWYNTVATEMQRVLAPNGSLFVFCWPQRLHETLNILSRHFKILQILTWAKTSGTFRKTNKSTLRTFPPSVEFIIFAEQRYAGTDYPSYDEKAHAQIFAPIREYFVGERDNAGLTNNSINAAWKKYRGARVGGDMARHWFTASQWQLPTARNYEWLRKLSHENGRPAFGREYENLRREYENLRREYENLRRYFSIENESLQFMASSFCVPPCPPATAGKKRHPCEKPLELIEMLVRVSTPETGCVLDPFLGSGTTAVACMLNNRQYVGIEKDMQYVEMATRRIALSDIQTDWRDHVAD